jgi:hypothetical protein
VFSIDVDEVEDFDPEQTDYDLINEGLDPITSGVEFQGSLLTAEFSAPHYHDETKTAHFQNRYDPLLAGTQLGLSSDNVDGKRDRTAGAVGQLQQRSLPVTIAGTVFEDLNSNILVDVGEPRLEGVSISLFVQQENQYVFTGHTTTTDANGNYLFSSPLDLMPGTYQVRETQPAGYLSLGAAIGTV